MELRRAVSQSTRVQFGGEYAGVSGTAVGTWAWNNQAPPPASGQVRTDTRDWATAAAVAIDRRNDSGTDVSASIAQVALGDRLRLEQTTDPTRFVIFDVRSEETLVTDTYSFSVARLSSGGTLPNSGARINVMRMPKGSVSGPPYNARGFESFGILLPSNFRGSEVSFLVASTADGEYRALYDISNALVKIAVLSGRAYALPPGMPGWPFWKLVSNAVEDVGSEVVIVAQA